MSAKIYWENHYAENTHSDHKEPSAFLQRMQDRLVKGRVLDMGMGEGANAVYLARLGFEVKGFDVAKEAVERAKNLAQDSGVQIDAQQADLDMYLFELMAFDTVIMTKFKPPVKRYYSEIIRTLKQGGTLLVDSFLVDEMAEAIPQEEAFRNFYYNHNELLHELKGLRILYYHEGKEHGRQVVQCLAKKPMDQDARKYNLFGMSTQGEEPKKSKQLELAEQLFKK
jgi:SAM-dependent methyltransferase